MLVSNREFEWTVIGAGPAGIAAVGKLLDNQVAPESIAWLDPCFKVGDFGTKWRNVPSNTKVHLFHEFLNACESFGYGAHTINYAIDEYNPQETCNLSLMADPLQWVTEQLQGQVCVIKGVAERLSMKNRRWNVVLGDSDGVVQSKNVVLAIGAEPRSLSHIGIEPIALDIALDREQLSKFCGASDTVAVFGSSHSAILVIRNLLESCSIKKVINFYQSPLRYAVEWDNEILFDNTGLKGATAQWAREKIHGVMPEKLERVLSNDKNMEYFLPKCTKSICAVGFEKRQIEVAGMMGLNHNPHTGIIAPGLFGLGIAFPQVKTDCFGNMEHRVGLWKFMEYLTAILPIWLRYPV